MVAKLAVQVDEASKAELRPLAISRYRRSVALIAAQLLRESEPSRRDALLKFATLYQQRAGVLVEAHGLTRSPEDDLDLSQPEACALLSARPLSGLAQDGGCTAVPAEGWRKTYWLCGQIAASIERGAHLAPEVFVPSAVWQQRGVRLAALPAKMAAFAELAEQAGPMASLLIPPPAADACAAAAATDYDLVLRECGLFVAHVEALHATLARTLPPACNVPPPYASPPMGAQPPPALDSQPSDPADAAASRLRKLGFFVARTASSLVGAAAADRPCADSSAYAAQVRELLLSLRSLERLHALCAAPGAPPALARALHLLERVNAFVHDVVLALVAQDLSALLSAHLRQAERVFVQGSAAS